MERFEGEILKCLDGTSNFTEDMIAKQIRRYQQELDDAKAEYAALQNTGCCKGERRQWRMQRTEAGAAVAECKGLLPPRHDAGTATRHYRAFWQRRCRAAAAGAVLKPQGGNCAVLP